MSSRPKLLDLFCGAGGAAVGYHRAGFEVVGVDLALMPRYPFEFHQADALEFLADRAGEFEAIHASPPCKAHTSLAAVHPDIKHPDLIPGTRAALIAAGVPWVIENVSGAPIRPDFVLCGCQFDLPGLRRPRWFETSWRGFSLREPCQHVGSLVTVSGHGSQGWEYAAGTAATQDDRERAMGIHWMNRDELSQAIPPAFAEYVGGHLTVVLQQAVA